MWILYGYMITLVVRVISPDKPSVCERARSKAKSEGLGTFVPTCKPDGTFEEKQCSGSTGYCWCVELTSGNEISGTRKAPADKITCDVTVTCASCPGGGSKLEGVVIKDLIVRYHVSNTNFQLLTLHYKENEIEITPNKVNSNRVKDKRLSVPHMVYNRGNSTRIDVTLKTLLLEDNDDVFKYTYVDNALDTSTGENMVMVKAPPSFCKAPKKTYEIEAGKKHGIEFDICGNPKPTTVTAKVGSVNVPVVIDVDAESPPPKYRYSYKAELTMKKEQCGDHLKIMAENFQIESFDSTMKLIYQPASVENVTANRDENNLLTVSWQKIKQFGSCIIQYNVKRTADGITEAHGTDKLTYVFHNAHGNNSISVNAEVNGKEGSYSDPIFIAVETKDFKASSVVASKDDGLKAGHIIGIIIGIIIIIACIVSVVVIMKRKQKKGDGNARYDVDMQPLSDGRTDEADWEVVDVNNSILKKTQQKAPQETIYAELGPGGGRTGQKPIHEQSRYAKAKTDGVYYPELQKSQQKPVVGSTSSRSKPSVSSVSNQHDDSSFDYESSIVI